MKIFRKKHYPCLLSKQGTPKPNTYQVYENKDDTGKIFWSIQFCTTSGEVVPCPDLTRFQQRQSANRSCKDLNEPTAKLFDHKKYPAKRVESWYVSDDIKMHAVIEREVFSNTFDSLEENTSKEAYHLYLYDGFEGIEKEHICFEGVFPYPQVAEYQLLEKTPYPFYDVDWIPTSSEKKRIRIPMRAKEAKDRYRQLVLKPRNSNQTTVMQSEQETSPVSVEDANLAQVTCLAEIV